MTTSRAKLSVYIIAFNEEQKIKDTINSVLWADEVIVADSFSTDKTAQIAQEMGARVVQIPFDGFGNLRNSALAACQHDWVFSLDSDERCTPEVQAEISAILQSDTREDIYFVPRKNVFMGRWIKRAWRYPNYRQPQLFLKSKMSYTPEPVHEGYVLKTTRVGHLRAAIWQIPFLGFEEILRKANRYSTLGAEKTRLNKKSSMGKAFTRASWSFLKHYVFKGGFLDGWAGFVIAFSNFEGTFYRHAKVVEKQMDWKQNPMPKE